MATTTAVLVLAGASIMLFSSGLRPEPRFKLEAPTRSINSDREDLELRIRADREEGTVRLLITLLGVGAAIEFMVFFVACYFSEKIVEPVRQSYEKQKVFIANASHELKTPLAVIQANIEALEVEKENQKWKDNIENEIEHANKLVLDLLQLARFDAGSLSKKTAEKINLAEEIRTRIEMFRPKFSGEIKFRNSGSEKYFLSKRDVLQVLDILLDNAAKYGKKKISVTLNREGVVVANDGAKVKKEDCEKIFDRFYQTDKTKEGSGLGLAIAKALCEQNGWKISCESGRTTKFTVSFKN